MNEHSDRDRSEAPPTGTVEISPNALTEPATTEPPAEVEQILSDLWNGEGVRKWWNAPNTVFHHRAPRDVWADGPGGKAVIEHANYLADGNW